MMDLSLLSAHPTSPFISSTSPFNPGDTYYGQYEGDLRHGYGTYINAQGAKFEGEWHRDKPKRRCPLPEHVKKFISEVQVSS